LLRATDTENKKSTSRLNEDIAAIVAELKQISSDLVMQTDSSVNVILPAVKGFQELLRIN
jgi:hypothetical protein